MGAHTTDTSLIGWREMLALCSSALSWRTNGTPLRGPTLRAVVCLRRGVPWCAGALLIRSSVGRKSHPRTVVYTGGSVPLVCSVAYEVCSGVKKPKPSPRREGLGKGSKGPAHPRLVRPAHCEFASITRPACGRAGAGPQRPMHTHKCPAQTRREQAVGQALAKQAGEVNRWRYRFPAATGLSGPRGAHTYDRPTAPLRCGSV